MDRPVIDELHARLTPEGEGGFVELDTAPEPAALAGLANGFGARFALLDGPTSKAQVIESLRHDLALPPWMGHTWDALEEVLGHPDQADHRGPMLVAWREPGRLPATDAATFRAIIASVGQARMDAGNGVLLVVAGPTPHQAQRPQSAQEATRMTAAPEHIRSLGKVHHVALVVASIETALEFWRDTLGAPLETIMEIEHDRVRIAFLTVGESKVELVQPTDDTTGVARFLAAKGEGFHHVCFEVDDLTAALTRLEIDGLELIDTAPRRGAEGPVAFLHPRSCHGVLVELIEAPGGPAWTALGPWT